MLPTGYWYRYASQRFIFVDEKPALIVADSDPGPRLFALFWIGKRSVAQGCGGKRGGWKRRRKKKGEGENREKGRKGEGEKRGRKKSGKREKGKERKREEEKMGR